jgi:Fe-S-cluster-containing dehydrogenase component
MHIDTANPPAGPASPPAVFEKEQGLTRRSVLSRLAAMGIVAAGAGAAALVSYSDDAHAAGKTQAATKQGAKGAEHAWCPVSATLRTDEGLVLVDTDTCVGSRACMAACPYEARYFNWKDPLPAKRMPMPNTPQMPVAKKGTVGKCVLCADRLPQGELPACVEACPMGVLYVGDLVTDVAVNGQGTTVVLSEFLRANDAVRFKEELGTNPRVWYILGHGQSLEGTS